MLTSQNSTANALHGRVWLLTSSKEMTSLRRDDTATWTRKYECNKRRLLFSGLEEGKNGKRNWNIRS